MKNGFTLLEVLIAVVILGTVLTTAIYAMSHVMRSSSSAAHLTYASGFMQDLSARIHAGEFKLGTYSGTYTTDRDMHYSWHVLAEKLNDTQTKVTYKVSWQESGKDKYIDAMTMVNKM